MTQLCLSETLTNSAQVYGEKKELVPYIILRRRKQHSSKIWLPYLLVFMYRSD
jgi:hypothetical protein